MNITSIKGIGEKTAALFSKINIFDTEDLLKHFPKDYSYYAPISTISSINENRVYSIKAMCTSGISSRYIRGMNIVTCRVSDETGEAEIVYFNMPYIRNSLKQDEEHVFRGNVLIKGNSIIFHQPKIYSLEEYARLSDSWQPLYSSTKGLSSNTIGKSVKKAFDIESKIISEESPLFDHLPKDIIKKRELISYKEAIYSIHFPENLDKLIQARKRLAYQEFFDYIMNIEKDRNKRYKVNSYPMIEVAEVQRLIESLPYSLTEDQISVWNEIKDDLTSPHGLERLVQGDVGSGKTIIAFLSLIMCVANGYQGALMAPTEVLARQHYHNLKEIIEKNKFPFEVALLTGSIKGKERENILSNIASGSINIIIGTHALFQEKVEYKALALAITDEQHRFGVLQRESLKDKGMGNNVLIMSATPIPRTLAMILYGDLDISAIHVMPNGRKPIKNCVVDRSFRKKAYEFVENEISQGHQVYIICPQVEAGENNNIENVQDYAKKLRNELNDNISIEYLHGQMKSSKKEDIMDRYSRGEIDVLVSTTVIEVGVNVPNATLMFVENAERFGLAQLHQLRGRVGRSAKQSYCIFMMGEASKNSQKRLEILEHSNDGFEIASADMQLRGPGDIFGIRQSGDMSFIIGDIYQDSELIINAAEDVRLLLQQI